MNTCNWIKIYDAPVDGNELSSNSLQAGQTIYLDLSGIPSEYEFIGWRDFNGNDIDDDRVVLLDSGRYEITVLCGDTFTAYIRSINDTVYYTVCVCRSFPFEGGWIEVKTSRLGTIAEISDNLNSCVDVEAGTEIELTYHVIDGDYQFNNWGTIDIPYTVIDEYTISLTPIADMEICPDIQYVNPFIPRIYVNIDFTQECKNEFAEDIPGDLYSNCVYVTGHETDTEQDSLTPFPPENAQFNPDYSLVPVEIYSDIEIGQTGDLWAKTNCCSSFDHWSVKIISEQGQTATTQINSEHIVITKLSNYTIYATAVYSCCFDCRGTFIIKDPEVKFEFNGIMYNYNVGTPLNLSLPENEALTVYPYTNSNYIGGIYDVTDPNNPIDVANIPATMATGSFCYESYPQTDNNGYTTFYEVSRTDVRFYNPNTPDIITVFRWLHTDNNHSTSPIYIDPTLLTWNNTPGDVNRNSFNDQPGEQWISLPIFDNNYNFNGTYYRFFDAISNIYVYYEKVTFDINGIPTLPAFPSTASIDNTIVSPYLIKCRDNSPYYNFTQGYNIYSIVHGKSSVINPWNFISGIVISDTEQWSPASGDLPTPTVTSKRFVTDKTTNATYVKRINNITFTPECNHTYEICGLGVNYSPREFMYLAVDQGIIPPGTIVTELTPQPGTNGYLSLADLSYYNPISPNDVGNFVKAYTNGSMVYYKIVSVC